MAGEDILSLLFSGVMRALQRHREHRQKRVSEGYPGPPDFKAEATVLAYSVMTLAKLGRFQGQYMQVCMKEGCKSGHAGATSCQGGSQSP